MSAEIIKTVTMVIETIFQDSKKVIKIRNYISRRNFYLYFLIYQNLLISCEKKADISRTPELCHVIHLFFGSSLGEV